MKKLLSPGSLVARTLWLTLIAVLLAQGIATGIWYSQTKQKELDGISSTSASMASIFASTVNFFQALPVQYRHIVLDQIRNMGGTRFFVSFNKEKLETDPIPDNYLETASINAVTSVLREKLNNVETISVEFSKPDKLRVLKNDIYLHDLPKSWAYYTLTLEPLNPPILVVQIELSTHEWIYIAALLPAPYVSLNDDIIGYEQLMFLLFSTLILMVLVYFLIRRQIRPIKNIATAANKMSIDIEQPELEEEGANELIMATRAFNRMQSRIRHYVHDRETLFSAISHDLKTPITRLRIRTELLDEDDSRNKFNEDLDELEMMVKGALQAVKDTDIHENNSSIDIKGLLHNVAELHNQHEVKVHIPDLPIKPIVGKPLAIKRVLSNLIDNGVKYGHSVVVLPKETPQGLLLTFEDRGEGIPEDKLEAVFEPYFRLAKDSNGHGLGLGICRNILHAHGGDLILKNSPFGGLCAEILIPRNLAI
ncbi:ATP-binding protein [Vibrio sp. SCSIO 43137]|uniref:ATP-binding protein n=1 Tax=Vibrio sp. SCSIO 43137 TaxID=3021011 RepID=UPI0023075AB2|nr:ATP-binding protein [Vibrio sp. SCSIO 43137]WCE31546.1 ATP-binding protein [Vibrio sp. SCSIO 43137]